MSEERILLLFTDKVGAEGRDQRDGSATNYSHISKSSKISSFRSVFFGGGGLAQLNQILHTSWSERRLLKST